MTYTTTDAKCTGWRTPSTDSVAGDRVLFAEYDVQPLVIPGVRKLVKFVA